jgi:hypothetical protein
MLAHFHGGERSHSMSVVCHRNHYGIDLLITLLEHDAPVVVTFGLRILPRDLGRNGLAIVDLGAAPPIDVAYSYNVLTRFFRAAPPYPPSR